MSTVTISEKLGDITAYSANPSMLIRKSIEVFEAIHDGSVKVVDATNPFVYGIENTATHTSAVVSAFQTAVSQTHIAMATSEDEIYRHLSDWDYVGRFATPSTATIKLILAKNELAEAMIGNSQTNIAEAIIPRNTVFTVGDTSFSLLYPVVLRRMPHGNFQAHYDNSVVTPLQTLSSNIAPISTLTDTATRVEYIEIELECTQFFITSVKQNVNASSGLITKVKLTDQFYCARAYMQLANGQWSELNLTHSDTVYDPKKPTVVLRVADGIVTMAIKPVYAITGLITGKVRLDVYETKGALQLNLQSFKFDQYKATWLNVDQNDNNARTAVMSRLKTYLIYSNSIASGGTNALSFTQLRERAIKNSLGTQVIPITPSQIEDALTSRGYEIVKHIDSVTNRVYLASKSAPQPTDPSILTATSASTSTVRLTLSQAAQAYGAYASTSSVTLSSRALYLTNNGLCIPVSTAAKQSLDSLSALDLCTAVTKNNYHYSPFYYVLDATQDVFDARAYFLDKPTIRSKSFVQENIKTQIQVSASSEFTINTTVTGFEIIITTISSDEFKALQDSQITLELSLQPKNTSLRAYCTAELIGLTSSGERRYRFNLDSKFFIDSDDYIEFTNIKIDGSELDVRSLLNQTFDLVFCVQPNSDQSWVKTDIDEILSEQTSQAHYGICWEQLNVHFGSALDKLWCKTRSVAGSVPYKRYEQTVYWTYDKDQYQEGPNGEPYVIVNGKATLVKTHSKGDYKLNSSGQKIVRYNVGDVVMDDSSNPVAQPGFINEMVRLVDIMMLDGVYYFATDEAAVTYRTQAVDTIVDWITDDLVDLSAIVLEKTYIYFSPKTTQGSIAVITDDGARKEITATQSLKIDIYVSGQVYENASLLQAIRIKTIKVVAAQLDQQIVDVTSICTAIASANASDVIGVKLTGLGADDDFNTVTMLNGSDRLSLAKKLESRPDGTFAVTENVFVNFMRHV